MKIIIQKKINETEKELEERNEWFLWRLYNESNIPIEADTENKQGKYINLEAPKKHE